MTADGTTATRSDKTPDEPAAAPREDATL